MFLATVPGFLSSTGAVVTNSFKKGEIEYVWIQSY